MLWVTLLSLFPQYSNSCIFLPRKQKHEIMCFDVIEVGLKAASLRHEQHTGIFQSREALGSGKGNSCFYILRLISVLEGEGRIKHNFLEIKSPSAKLVWMRGKGFQAVHTRQQYIYPQHTVLTRWYLLPNLPSASLLKALSSSRISASASSSSNSKRTILWPRNPPAPVTRQLTPARDIALGCSLVPNWLFLELRAAGSPPAWGNEHMIST